MSGLSGRLLAESTAWARHSELPHVTLTPTPWHVLTLTHVVLSLVNLTLGVACAAEG